VFLENEDISLRGIVTIRLHSDPMSHLRNTRTSAIMLWKAKPEGIPFQHAFCLRLILL